jgi:hypothetical protein
MPRRRSRPSKGASPDRRCGILLLALLALFLSPFAASSSPLPAAERPCVYIGVERVVAVGDLHGAFDKFVEILKDKKVIDDSLRWSGGKTHLVQLGDIMDRGDQAREILDLIQRLEVEAEAAGGRVHMLIGNHEEMNILGISFEVTGLVTGPQFKSFVPEGYWQKLEKGFLAKAGPGADLDAFWKDTIENNEEARKRYKDTFNREYGLWIARHNVMIKIDGIVFVHGGVNEALSLQSCETLNERTSTALTDFIRYGTFQADALNLPRGLLWYRDLATTPEEVLRAELDRILANLGARAIVTGHTPLPGSVSTNEPSRFGEKVWIIDTGIWMGRDGNLAALIIENGKIKLEKVDR